MWIMSDKGARVLSTIVVAILLFLPTFVRATQSVKQPDTATVIRLNRGFDAPEGKWKVEPPVEMVPQPTAPDISVTLRVALPISTDDALPSQYDSPPDALRGPPAPIFT
jgi:hypothetical protein